MTAQFESRTPAYNGFDRRKWHRRSYGERRQQIRFDLSASDRRKSPEDVQRTEPPGTIMQFSLSYLPLI